MKNMKKILALLVAVLMIAASVSAFAANEGKITIENAAKGEKYSLYKIFDATISEAKTDGVSDSIAYKFTGTLPEANLGKVFEKIEGTDYVKLKDAYKGTAHEADVLAEVQAYANTLSAPTYGPTEATGGALEFNVDYGYYVIKSTQNNGALVTVDSANPNATVRDKNTTTPQIGKKVDDKDVYIGETVTYTLDATTTNWLEEDGKSYQVVKYEIADTLPNYLDTINVTSIIVDNDGNAETTDDQTTLPVQQFADKKIVIDWATGTKGNYTNTYKNGAHIFITYTAKVNSNVNVGDADGNRNVVTLQPYIDKGNDTPDKSKDTWKDDEIIKTYGAALYKVDENDQPLAGAKFSIKGLTVTGSNGEYTVSAFDASENAADGTEMECDADGVLIILGLASDVDLTVKETEAPAGYNKLTETKTLKPIKMSETVSFTETTVYYDSADVATRKVVHTETESKSTKTVTATGNDLKANALALKVINEKGLELPSTGGIGTTLFYIGGGILVLAAVILLVTKRRMNAND